MPPPIEKLDASLEELLGLVEQARAVLSADGYRKLKAGIHTLGYVTELLENQEATLDTLRTLLCPTSTEKTAKVLAQAGLSSGEKPSQSADQEKTSNLSHRRKRTRQPGRIRRLVTDAMESMPTQERARLRFRTRFCRRGMLAR